MQLSTNIQCVRLLLLMTTALSLQNQLIADDDDFSSDFVTRTNLLVRVRERCALRAKYEALQKKIEQTAEDKAGPLRKKLTKLGVQVQNMDIYLKNLTIQSLKDPLQALMEMMALADIYCRDLALLAEKEATLPQAASAGTRRSIRNDIDTIKKNITLNNTLLKKILFKDIDTSTPIPKPTPKSSKKADAFDAKFTQYLIDQATSTPDGKAVGYLRDVIPIRQEITVVLDAIYFTLEYAHTLVKELQAQTLLSNEQLSEYINRLPVLLRIIDQTRDRQSRMVKTEVSSLHRHNQKHQAQVLESNDQLLIKKPNPFLGEHDQAQQQRIELIVDLLSRKRALVGRLSIGLEQIAKTKQQLSRAIDVISKKAPLAATLLEQRKRRLSHFEAVNRHFTKRLIDLFNQYEKEKAKARKALKQEGLL